MCEHDHQHQDLNEDKSKILSITVSLIVMILAILSSQNSELKIWLFFISYLIAGWDVLLTAVKNIFKGELFDENFLMTIATAGALAIGEYPEAVMVMVLYQIGEFLQDRAVEKSRKSITALMDIRPDYANIEQDGKLTPKLKKSDSIEKITNPGFKTLYRIYNKNSGKAFADVIALRGEKLPKPLVLTHETERWKQSVLKDYEARELMVQIIDKGECVYSFPSIEQNAAYRRAEKADFWEEYKRLESPHIHKVDLSEGLYELKQKLLLVD